MLCKSSANIVQTHANILQIAGKSPKISNTANIISYASMYDPRTCFFFLATAQVELRLDWVKVDKKMHWVKKIVWVNSFESKMLTFWDSF